MERKDIADMYVVVTGKIDWYWRFYSIFILGLVGWIVSTKESPEKEIKVVISVGYFLFAGMNVMALSRIYKIAEAVRKDLVAFPDSEQGKIQNTLKEIGKKAYTGETISMYVIHLLMAFGITWVIWFAW